MMNFRDALSSRESALEQPLLDSIDETKSQSSYQENGNIDRTSSFSSFSIAPHSSCESLTNDERVSRNPSENPVDQVKPTSKWGNWINWGWLGNTRVNEAPATQSTFRTCFKRLKNFFNYNTVNEAVNEPVKEVQTNSAEPIDSTNPFSGKSQSLSQENNPLSGSESNNGQTSTKRIILDGLSTFWSGCKNIFASRTIEQVETDPNAKSISEKAKSSWSNFSCFFSCFFSCRSKSSEDELNNANAPIKANNNAINTNSEKPIEKEKNPNKTSEEVVKRMVLIQDDDDNSEKPFGKEKEIANSEAGSGSKDNSKKSVSDEKKDSKGIKHSSFFNFSRGGRKVEPIDKINTDKNDSSIRTRKSVFLKISNLNPFKKSKEEETAEIKRKTKFSIKADFFDFIISKEDLTKHSDQLMTESNFMNDLSEKLDELADSNQYRNYFEGEKGCNIEEEDVKQDIFFILNAHLKEKYYPDPTIKKDQLSSQTPKSVGYDTNIIKDTNIADLLATAIKHRKIMPPD